jgi:hypothetical protein
VTFRCAAGGRHRLDRAPGAALSGCCGPGGTSFIDPVRKVRVLTTAGPLARSIADLRLALQLIGCPDGLVAARGEDGQLAPPRREA